MRAFLLALALLAGAGTPALAAPAQPVAAKADGVQARMAPVTVLRGRFEQEKQVQGFARPLLSSGDFVLAKDRGVAWNTRAPFASSLVMTPKGWDARRPDGSKQALGNRKVGRAVTLVNRVMMALLAGDVPALERDFEMRETMLPDGRWRLALVPRTASLKRAVRSIELEGGRHIERVAMDDARGDRTVIRFLDVSDKPATLTPAEAASLD